MLSLKIVFVLMIVQRSLSQQFSQFSASQQFSQFSSTNHQFGRQQPVAPQKPFGSQNQPFGSQQPIRTPQNFGQPQSFAPQAGFAYSPQPRQRLPPQNFGQNQNFRPNQNFLPNQNFRPDRNFDPQQTHFIPQTQPTQEEQFIPPPLCLAVQFINQTDEGWQGRLNIKAPKDLNGVEVDVMFDDYVPIFANDLGQTSSTNNRIFSISDSSKNLKKGETFKVDFFAKSGTNSKISFVTGVRLNNILICPEETPLREGETRCGKVEMNGEAVAGRWNGTLSLYPQFSGNGVKIDIELDETAWALGNNFGETKTLNQKKFTINGKRNIQTGMKLVIDFFVKYDELEEIPQIKSVSVNNIPICLLGSSALSSEDNKEVISNEGPSEPIRPSGISLQDLSLENFPSVTQIPPQVNNVDFDCGGASSLQSRIHGGSEAKVGQFPFHTAIYRDSIYRCGGSLISEGVVVTACHCVVNDIKTILPKEGFHLLFGSVNLKRLSGNEALREVSDILIHPDYAFDKILKQDIALMFIKGNLQLSPSIRTICLFSSQTPISSLFEQQATVLGFGSNESSREPSEFLNYGKMEIISRQQCIESKLIFGLLPEESAFCAKAVNNMIACPGDSGGALILNQNGKHFLRGVSSVTITENANGRCDSRQSVAFTDVSFFLTWIRQNMR